MLCHLLSISSRVRPEVSGIKARAKTRQNKTTPAKMKKRPPRPRLASTAGRSWIWDRLELVSVKTIRPTPMVLVCEGKSSPKSSWATLLYLNLYTAH